MKKEDKKWHSTYLEIIETYWNVNPSQNATGFTLALEIIETYWNVNIIIRLRESEILGEIIETYWNVNYKIGCCRGGGNWGNNRNILECK